MRKSISLLALLILSYSAKAQIDAIKRMNIFVETHFNSTDSINGSDSLYLEVLKEPQMLIELTDTNNITTFNVKLGTTFGGSEIFEKTFDFNNIGEFQDGTSYIRQGNYVRILLGKYPVFSAYHAQVMATVNGSQQSAVTSSGQ
ncbi:MAG: hypothetical protein M0D57_08490 [Sphingobacteriales bacterium JAD_PAG50586_3]|nr:MAG: hypothetical protein M0D57_08490 [Sphingobacteriales bacterium JAD_PAG50586_3]